MAENRARPHPVTGMAAERPVILMDGTPGIVRTIRSSDSDALATSLADLDPDSRIRRFFFDKKRFSESELKRLANPDGVDHIAYGLAVSPNDDSEFTPIAVARCIRDKLDGEMAEVAIVTADLWQGLGAGTELMKSLSAAALEVGIRRWFASMFADNIAVLKLLDKFGMQRERRNLGGGIIEVVYEIVEPPGGFFTAPTDMHPVATAADIGAIGDNKPGHAEGGAPEP